MRRLCCVSAVVLVLVVAAMAYQFLFSGKVVASKDGRAAIVLTAAERERVLAEMRAFLEGVQAVTAALARNDMSAVAAAARPLGMAAPRDMPGTLMGKLPMGFKQMGMDTHRRFDELALDAEQWGDPARSLEQLAELLGNCTACHAAYRFVTEAE